MIRNILIPVVIYHQDPIRAIKSILGNDIMILNYHYSDVILPNNSYLVTVEYDCIDFSPLDVFETINIKRVNTNSDKYCCNVMTSNNVLSKQLIQLSSNNIKFVRINSTKSEIDDSNNLVSIHYYGIQITKNNVLNDYITIFGNDKTTYHGNLIQQFDETELNTKFKDIIGENEFKNINIDLNLENDNLKHLRNVSHDYVHSYFDLKYFMSIDEIEIVKSFDQMKSGVIDISNFTPNEFIKTITNLPGFILILSKRSSPLSVIYIYNIDYTIDQHQSQMLTTVLLKDTINWRMISE